MSGLVKKAIGCYPALANGPLAKPDGFRDASKTFMKKMSVPMAVVSLAFFGASYVSSQWFSIYVADVSILMAFKMLKVALLI